MAANGVEEEIWQTILGAGDPETLLPEIQWDTIMDEIGPKETLAVCECILRMHECVYVLCVCS